MPETDQLRRALDREFPRLDDRLRDWDDVLRRATLRPPKRRIPVLRLAGAAAVVAGVALFATSPWQGAKRVGVVDRALAAIGDGPVLHLVLRGEAVTLVDLRTDRRQALSMEQEVWIDPERGITELTRFEGTVIHRFVGSSAVPFPVEFADYREALESGRARVVGSGVVDGIPVYWIHVRQAFAGGPDEAELQVAVSKETYKPVYLRAVRQGKPVAGLGTRVLDAEQLPAGSGDFSPVPEPTAGQPCTKDGPDEVVESTRSGIGLGEVSKILRGHAVWLGGRFHGLKLYSIDELTIKSCTPNTSGPTAKRRKGVSLNYEGPANGKGLRTGLRASLIETHGPALDRLGNYEVPAGHAVLLPGGGSKPVYLRRAGTYVVIGIYGGEQSDETALVMARALRPLSVGSGAPG